MNLYNSYLSVLHTLWGGNLKDKTIVKLKYKMCNIPIFHSLNKLPYGLTDELNAIIFGSHHFKTDYM